MCIQCIQLKASEQVDPAARGRLRAATSCSAISLISVLLNLAMIDVKPVRQASFQLSVCAFVVVCTVCVACVHASHRVCVSASCVYIASYDEVRDVLNL